MNFPPATPRHPLRQGSARRLNLRGKRHYLGGSLGNWLLWGGIGLLLGQRLRSLGTHLQWWRVSPVVGLEGSLGSTQTELPLYHS
ncbi:MAG: hypothetical protein Q6K80_12145, partial [Thermostichus sp. DG_1_6_bins_120]